MPNPIHSSRPDAPELGRFGPHPIGVRRVTFTRPDQPILGTPTTPPTRGTRAIVVEMVYPAPADTPQGGTYDTLIRDGHRPVTLTGRARRDAPVAPGQYPLVLLSHGYPGNRFLMAHLAEKIASHGFVCASIDHPDSLYHDQTAFGATLYHRPRDQRFVLDQCAVGAEVGSDLGAVIDTSRTGLIGYSMGGYGALTFAGAGIAPSVLDWPTAPADGLLGAHVEGSQDHADLVDPRLCAVIGIGPWGKNNEAWTAQGLARIKTPTMIMAGSRDDISSYPAMRAIFEQTSGTTRNLLTFDNAGHNAAAPYTAPSESMMPSKHLDFLPFEHYADPVWDTGRMNHIAQHFAVAFMTRHLRQEPQMDRFLSDDFAGFAPGSALGLRFETRAAGQ